MAHIFLLLSTHIVLFFLIIQPQSCYDNTLEDTQLDSIDRTLSATSPEYLPEIEVEMAMVIRRYLQLESNSEKSSRLYKLALYLEVKSYEHAHAVVADPVSLYLAVSSLLDQWAKAQLLMKTSSFMEAAESARQLPKREDVDDIILALFRTQDTYRFNTSDIASGFIRGLSGNLTAYHCYDIGITAFEKSDYYHSLMWLQEAESRFLVGVRDNRISEADILAPLAISFAKKGNKKHALKEAARLLQLSEQCNGIKGICSKYPSLGKLLAAVSNNTAVNSEDSILPPIKNKRFKRKSSMTFLEDYFDPDQLPYEKLCRGEKIGAGLPKEILSLFLRHVADNAVPLSCHYKRASPFLLLAPVKTEVINMKPLLLLYRSVISDREIKTLQSLVIDDMNRSEIVTRNGTTIRNNVRLSSTGWLPPGIHKDVATVTKRAGLITGLNMDTAESLQVTRYDIGGYYTPHHDHDSVTATGKLMSLLNGDRIATLMFYLNEPKAGGATVFPLANAYLQPSKNDAIFWYNLKNSGAADDDTLHAGCPVISGVKWVANQWIVEHGQEFNRPCGLREDD